MKKRLIALLLVALFAFTLFSGCGGTSGGSGSGGTATNAPSQETDGGTGDGDGGASSAAPRDKILIGIINPTTGPLAGFGEGAPWTEQLIVDYVNNELGGIYFEDYDASLPIEIIMYDSESDTTKCTELTQKLITDDQVDLVVVRHTPETVNPVTAVCERYEMPCVAMEAPVDAWLAEGPYEWSFHSMWNLDSMYEAHSSIWKAAGFGEGSKVGMIFANDADGTAWANVFKKRVPADGYVLVDPGQYPSGTQDYSDIISLFKSEGVDVLCGTNINPDFSTFWRQAQQLGFQPGSVTMGKAFLLESDALAIGADLMDGLACEVWWSPTHPYISELTGLTAPEFTELYENETGRKITQPMGYKYASMEVAVDALSRAGSLDKTAIRDAIAETDIDTMIGHVKYNDEHYSLTPLAGGQWVKNEDGGLDLIIVDNTLNPEIATTGTLKPLEY